MAIAVPALDEEPIIAVLEQPDRPWLAWLAPTVGHLPERRPAERRVGSNFSH